MKKKRKQYVASNAAEILGLFRAVIELGTISQGTELHQLVRQLLSSGPALELLRGFAIKNMDLLKVQIIDPLLQPGKAFVPWLQLLVDNLLDDNDLNGRITIF